MMVLDTTGKRQKEVGVDPFKTLVVETRETEYMTRYRPSIHPPSDPGQYPILIKAIQGHYVPRQTLDLAGLVAGLPDIHEGENMWIRDCG